MSTDLVPFSYQGAELRTVVVDGEQVSRSTRVTAKGLDWLSRRFGRAAS